jgi:hypothetical protein
MLDEDDLHVHHTKHWRNLGVLNHAAKSRGRRFATITARRTVHSVARAAAFEFGATDPEGFARLLMDTLWSNPSMSLVELLAEMRS